MKKYINISLILIIAAVSISMNVIVKNQSKLKPDSKYIYFESGFNHTRMGFSKNKKGLVQATITSNSIDEFALFYRIENYNSSDTFSIQDEDGKRYILDSLYYYKAVIIDMENYKYIIKYLKDVPMRW